MLTREDIIKKIEESLDGKINNKKLTEWADDQLWNEETCKNRYDDKHLRLIADTIHTLISMDGGPNFDLSEEDLRNIIKKLSDDVK